MIIKICIINILYLFLIITYIHSTAPLALSGMKMLRMRGLGPLFLLGSNTDRELYKHYSIASQTVLLAMSFFAVKLVVNLKFYDITIFLRISAGIYLRPQSHLMLAK